MTNWEKIIIPLDDAHKILAVFGIDPSSRECQRWRRDDGFRQVDFEGVLSESGAVIIVDWREWLQDAVDLIIRQLNELGIKASADLGGDGNEGFLQIDEKTTRIKFVPEDEDDFDRIIEAVNRLIGEAGHTASFAPAKVRIVGPMPC
jgi:hypothetical protein